MVTRDGGYFGHPFKGYRGVTKGDPLSPNIFNVVLDAVICHWVKVATPTELGMDDLYWQSLTWRRTSTPTMASERLQRAFCVLTSLLNRVGLQTNKNKTVWMVCQPCYTPGQISEEAYKRWTTGIGNTFWEQHQRRVEFLECGVEVEAVLLMIHRQIQYGVGQGDRGGHPPPSSQPQPLGRPIITRSPYRNSCCSSSAR